MDFGSRIRQLRTARGISLRDFAEMVGIDFTYLSKIENGKVDPPSEDKIRVIASKLDIEAEQLLGLAGKISSDQIRKAVESNPDVGILLRKLQSRSLTHDQVKNMLKIASEKDKSSGE
ncbi:MAG: XRE family transcriptional regulator [Anaerolineae bacterium]|nr:XRE family transcriptional regulator [Chloroflexi bacterium CFX2]MCQ3945171.1 XRE family transcriptional regulator [Anaerolineae bacterium]MCZ7550946.1 helix-turn-helix domain-containing protein [Anaerolineales bacterium]GER79147.1 transcriptional regulator XRE family [Candidatus Denitrolinea symbiosum]HPO85011.1 helix-turn-helix transcriptional regulator [Candidatus Hydrogenedentota bacterium]